MEEQPKRQKTEDEIRSYRRQSLELWAKLDQRDIQLESQRMELEQQRKVAQDLVLAEVQKGEDLRAKLEFLLKEDVRLKQEVENQQNASETLKRKQKEELARVEQQKEDLTAQLTALKKTPMTPLRSGSDQEEIKRLTKLLQHSETQRERESQEAARQATILARTQSQLTLTTQRLQDTEQRLGLSKAAEEAYRDQRVNLVESGEKDREIELLRQDLAVLRQKEQNVELLLEKLRMADAAQANVRALTQEVLRVESVAATLEAQLHQWVSCFAPVVKEKDSSKESTLLAPVDAQAQSEADTVGPFQVMLILNQLKNENLVLLNDKGLAETAALQAERKLNALTPKLAKCEAERAAAEEQRKSLQMRVDYLEGALRAVTDQRNAIKTILEEESEGDSKSTELLSLLDLAQKQAAAAEDARQAMERQLIAAKEALTRSEVKAECLEVEKKEVERALKRTEEEAAVMEERLGRGEFNASNIKVLHLANNPEKELKAATQAKLKAALEENALLKERLTGLGDDRRSGGVSSVNAAPSLAPPSLSAPDQTAEITTLKRSLQDAEKKIDRLKQVFRQKVTEFREACAQLTGYNIEMSQNKFLLKSMYAESPSDYLAFQTTQTGLQVLETEQCRSLSPDVLSMLHEFNSIPAFLSRVTLDLFSNTTRARRILQQ